RPAHAPPTATADRDSHEMSSAAAGGRRTAATCPAVETTQCQRVTTQVRALAAMAPRLLLLRPSPTSNQTSRAHYESYQPRDEPSFETTFESRGARDTHHRRRPRGVRRAWTSRNAPHPRRGTSPTLDRHAEALLPQYRRCLPRGHQLLRDVRARRDAGAPPALPPRRWRMAVSATPAPSRRLNACSSGNPPELCRLRRERRAERSQRAARGVEAARRHRRDRL